MNKQSEFDAPWQLIAKEQTSSAAKGPTYLVLPSKHNARWIVPLANRTVAWHGLDLYSPSTVSGRLYRRALQLLTYVPAWLQRNSVTLDECSRTNIARYIDQQSFKYEQHHIAISCGTNWARRKVTIQVMNANGVAQFYLKLGKNNSSREAIQREADMLRFLSEEKKHIFKNTVPELIGTFELDDHLVLVQKAGPTFNSKNKLTSAHWGFLSRMLLEEKKVKFPDWFLHESQLGRRLQALKPSLDNNTFQILKSALDFLLKMRAITICACIEHGDFAPWNIRQAGHKLSEKLFVFDWEKGLKVGVPMFDAFHFTMQVSILVAKANPLQTLTSLTSLSEVADCSNYLRFAGIQPTQIPYLLNAYLLAVAIDGIELGELTDSSPLQKARIKCLSKLLN